MKSSLNCVGSRVRELEEWEAEKLICVGNTILTIHDDKRWL